MYEEKVIYGIYGLSGFGREVLPLIRDELLTFSGNTENIFFVDDAIKDDSSTIINNHKAISFNDFMKNPLSNF